jgi:hypothetical protein
MFARIQVKHPQMTAALVDRIRRREFDKIVHIDDIAKPGFSGDFGPQVSRRYGRTTGWPPTCGAITSMFLSTCRRRVSLAVESRGGWLQVPVGRAKTVRR